MPLPNRSRAIAAKKRVPVKINPTLQSVKRKKLKAANKSITPALTVEERELTEAPHEQEELIVSISQFDRRLKKLRRLKSEDATEQAYSLAMYQNLRETALDLLSIAEAQYRRYKNDKAIYPVVNLQKEIREITMEIRRLEDFSKQAQRLTDIQLEGFKVVSAFLVNKIHETGANLKADLNGVSPKVVDRTLQALREDCAKYMQEALNMMNSRTKDLFKQI